MISVGKRASSPVARVGPRWPWEPFVWAAIWLTLTAGFGTGALLFGVLAAGVPVGLWWPVHAQIHGHAQVFGWLGLMVIGVGLHFLPRLRGANLAGTQFGQANLSQARLEQARATNGGGPEATAFPRGFDPLARGVLVLDH